MPDADFSDELAEASGEFLDALYALGFDAQKIRLLTEILREMPNLDECA